MIALKFATFISVYTIDICYFLQHNEWINFHNEILCLIFVVPSIMLYSSEISPTRCNNCVFILRSGFILHVLLLAPFTWQHDTEQGSDYQQLHNDRTIYY